MNRLSMITRYLLFLMLWATSASAHVLSFLPAHQNDTLGNQAHVDVIVSGVLPQGLGSYDFDVVFDPTVLAFQQAIDHFGLGSAIGLGTSAGTDRVTVSDFSLELPQDLLAMQSDSFPLLTLVFDTLELGTSGLSFDTVTMGDVEGAPVALEAAVPGSVSVVRAQVPEPATLALLVAGMAVAFGFRRTRDAAEASPRPAS